MVSGKVVRGVTSSARLRMETFRLRIEGTDAMPWDGPGPAEHVVGEYEFHGTFGAPILIWDGEVRHVRSNEDVDRFFAGNVARHSLRSVTVIDATGLDRLPDAEFWPIVDVLGGRMWEKTIRSAARQLSMRDESFILRWSETAGLKAWHCLTCWRPREWLHATNFI